MDEIRETEINFEIIETVVYSKIDDVFFYVIIVS